MKGLRLIILLLITAGFSAFADTIPSVSIANEQYRKGEFEKAINSYEKVIASGVEAPEIYYNLGNSYYRSNRIPLAILNYERAKKLKPNDEEINFNLELARSRIVDKINALPELFLLSWLKKLAHSFSCNQWAWISMISFLFTLCLAGFFLFSARRWVKQLSFWSGLLIFLITIGSFAISQHQKQKIYLHDDAIVVTASVTVRSSPAETGTELFILHEGSKVHIGDSVGDWLEIRIPDGNKGWIRATDLVRI
jgi:tetratricopeptide (TPR) repeat protein